MAALSMDLTGLPMGLRRSIDARCRDEKAKALVAAKARQTAAARWFREHPPRAVDGIGGQVMHIDPVLWSVLRHGTRAAPGESGEVQDWLKRREPEAFRVRHLPTKLQVGYWSTPEWRPAVRNVEETTRGGLRWRKIYAVNGEPTTNGNIMKDNIHQVVEYSIEAPGRDVEVRYVGTVTGYNQEGTVVHVTNHKVVPADLAVPVTEAQAASQADAERLTGVPRERRIQELVARPRQVPVVTDGQEVRFPVGQFLVRRIISKLAPKDQLVAAGLAHEGPADDAAPHGHGERRVSAPGATAAKRAEMGRRAPLEHGTAAAGPEEFAKPN